MLTAYSSLNFLYIIKVNNKKYIKTKKIIKGVMCIMKNSPTYCSTLWELFYTFAKIGAITFGGGYAMLPILQSELIDRKHWTTTEELTKYFAIGQCTPGVIAVNTATLIGHKKSGYLGGIVATLGLVTPSIIIILLIATFISNIYSIKEVAHAFSGIRICIAAMILNSVIGLVRSGVKSKLGIVIFLAAVLITTFTNLSPVAIIIPAAILGIIFLKKGEQK